MTNLNAVPTPTTDQTTTVQNGNAKTGKFDQAITTAEKTQSPADQSIHTVKKGETLWSISKKYYGDGTKFESIMGANIMDSEKLQPGMRLRIPSKQQVNQPRPKYTQPEPQKQSLETVWDGVDLDKAQVDKFKTVPLAIPDNPQTLPPKGAEPLGKFDPDGGVDLFPVGQELPKTETRYVLPGETYSSIAEQYLGDANKYPQLMQDNNATSDRLMPGDEITVPFKKKPEAKTIPLTLHEKRQEMFGAENTKQMEYIDKVEKDMEGMDVSSLKQLPTADTSKDAVDGGQTGTSGFYGALLMNAQNGGVDKAKASKFFGKSVANFLQKMPTGTKYELYTDNLETYLGDKSGGNEWGNFVVQIRASTVKTWLDTLPKPLSDKIQAKIRKNLPSDIAESVISNRPKEKSKIDRAKKQLPPGKLKTIRNPKNKHTRITPPQFDTQHWNNARIRIGFTLRDLANAGSHALGKAADAVTGSTNNVDKMNLEPGTQGMSGIEKAFDSATVGINYDIMMDGSNVPMLNGTNFYAQIRSKPQDIISNHLNGNNSGQENDFVFLIGAESGDVNDFVKNADTKEKKRKKLKIPTSKKGLIVKGLGEGFKAILPGTTGLGVNIQFSPNAAKAMINKFGERVYIANIDGKNVALPPAMTSTIDNFTAQDHIRDGHAPVKKPDMTLEEYITDNLLSKVITSTPVKDAAYAGVQIIAGNDADTANMEFGDKIYKAAYLKYVKTHPEFIKLSGSEKREVSAMLMAEVKKLAPDAMTTDGDPFKDFDGFVDEVLHNAKVQSRAYGTF